MDFFLTVATMVISLLVGGLITGYVSRRYYRKASEDLEREARELRKQSSLMLRALHEMSITGNVEYNTNAVTGEPEGLVVRRTATSHMKAAGGEAHVETGKAAPTPPLEQQGD